MNLTPATDRVICKLVKSEENAEVSVNAENGPVKLYLASAASENKNVYQVVRLGQFSNLMSSLMSLEEGDKIIVGEHAGITFIYNNEEYRCFKREDILARVEN